MKRILGLTLIVLLTSSCYTSKKLDRQVRVQLNMGFAATLEKDANAKYIDKHNEEAYKAAFKEGLKRELGYSNVLLVDDNPEFVVNVSTFVIKESIRKETVKDTGSTHYGKTFELSTCDLNSTGNVKRPSTDENLGDWNADKQKEEKLTNNRSLGQIIVGTNKDGSVTRVKQFDDNTFVTLAEQCGRRSGVRIVKLISKKAG